MSDTYAQVMKMATSSAGQVFDAAVADFRAGVDEVLAADGEAGHFVFEDVPAPKRLAPFATSVAASVHREPASARDEHDADEAASGRLVLLHDPAGQESWSGVFRLVAFDNFNAQTLFLNARLGTYGVAIAVLAALAYFGKKRKDELGLRGAMIAVVALNVLALVALSLEVSDYYARQMSAARPAYHSGRYAPNNVKSAYDTRSIQIAEDFTYSALWMAYGAMLMIIGFWRRSSFVRWQALVLIAVTIIKVFAYDFSQLDRGYRIVSFIVLGILLLAISFVYQRDWLQLSGARRKSGDIA